MEGYLVSSKPRDPRLGTEKGVRVVKLQAGVVAVSDR